MKLLILSDTHMDNDFLNIIKTENPNYTLHAGDSQLEIDNPILSNIDYIAKGNCDFSNFTETLNFEIKSTNFLLTHGHLYNVKLSLDKLIYLALENHTNILIYGHTHIVHIEYLYDEDLLILNPGSTTYGRQKFKKTYIVLEIFDDEFVVFLKDAIHFSTIEKFTFDRYK